MTIAYNEDIVAWANEQAALIRAGQFTLLDVDNIAEEILDVGKSERRELENRMSLLLAHLLKWKFQPKKRSKSWELTLRNQRRSLIKRLKKTPSLKSDANDPLWLNDVLEEAVAQAALETGLTDFPDICPWTVEEILTDGWLPD